MDISKLVRIFIKSKRNIFHDFRTNIGDTDDIIEIIIIPLAEVNIAYYDQELFSRKVCKFKSMSLLCFIGIDWASLPIFFNENFIPDESGLYFESLIIPILLILFAVFEFVNRQNTLDYILCPCHNLSCDWLNQVWVDLKVIWGIQTYFEFFQHQIKIHVQAQDWSHLLV